MKIIAHLAAGASLRTLHARSTAPSPRPEGEVLREKSGGRIYSTIIRWRTPDGWAWRGIETDGAAVWYYEIVPAPTGTALKPSALRAFEPAPGYDYMVEGIIPLAPDSPDRLIAPDEERAADLAKWRAKYVAASTAAAAIGSLGGSSTSPAKQAASRANGAKGGRPRAKRAAGKPA